MALAPVLRLGAAGGVCYYSVKAGVWSDGRNEEVSYLGLLASKRRVQDETNLIKTPEVQRYMSSVLSNTHEGQILGSAKHSFYQGWNNYIGNTFLFLSGQSSSSGGSQKLSAISKRTVSKIKEWMKTG